MAGAAKAPARAVVVWRKKRRRLTATAEFIVKNRATVRVRG
jgi:hypothetical protein